MISNISDKEIRAIDWNLAYLKGERPYACFSIDSIDHLEKLFEEDKKKMCNHDYQLSKIEKDDKHVTIKCCRCEHIEKHVELVGFELKEGEKDGL